MVLVPDPRNMPDVSTVFELLTSDLRRQLLLLLCESEPIQVPDGLVTRRSARPDRTAAQSDPSPGDGGSRDIDIALRHNHLPKLEDAGLIEWDPDAGTVSRGPQFEEVEPLLRLLAANADALPGDLF